MGVCCMLLRVCIVAIWTYTCGELQPGVRTGLGEGVVVFRTSRVFCTRDRFSTKRQCLVGHRCQSTPTKVPRPMQIAAHDAFRDLDRAVVCNCDVCAIGVASCQRDLIARAAVEVHHLSSVIP